MKMSEFADFFFSMILYIQQDRLDLIAPDTEFITDYGILGSERQGATAGSQASKVTEYVITRMNGCNIEEEDAVHGLMHVVYHNANKSWVKFWRFCCHFDAYF